MKEKTLTRENMMRDKNYVPYCGSCHEMSRMMRNDNNDGCICPVCDWSFTFPEEFMKRYNEKWETK